MKEEMTTENVNSSNSVTEEDSPRLIRQGHCWKYGSEIFSSVELFWLFNNKKQSSMHCTLFQKHVSTKAGNNTNLFNS